MTSADSGREKIAWTGSHMPMLRDIRGEFATTRPFEGLTIGICLHIEPKTAVLCSVLAASGATVAITGSPGTTQADVAAALAEAGHHVYHDETGGRRSHDDNIRRVLSHQPNLLLDNGADLVVAWIEAAAEAQLLGGTEETTTGANRLREELAGRVGFPVIVINDSPLKRIVENEHGVGQTVVEALMRVTNLMVPAKRFVVFGYGWCGRGIARTLKRLGGQVAVVEPDAIKALEAALDGMIVREAEGLLGWGRVFITATGRPGVLKVAHFGKMADGAILANAGHFSWEIDVEGLRKSAKKAKRLGEAIEEFELADGKRLSLLTSGEMVNLAGGGGNPAETMDMGLSLQARSLELVARRDPTLRPGPQPVPSEVNAWTAKLMLRTLQEPTE